jgi:transcriptional regulator with XRE-family HTH domain
VVGSVCGVRQIEPTPRRKSTAGRTKLANARLRAEFTQHEMSEWTGIPMATYRRLERGKIPNPHIGHLANCAIVLARAPGGAGRPGGGEWTLEDLIEDEWRQWRALSDGVSVPPETLPRRYGT